MDAVFPNIRHLRVFVEVGRCGSVSQAAVRSNLSQPAVTQALAKLEKQVEVALFTRHKSGLYLSEIGQLYFGRVEKALELLALGAQSARRLGRLEANSSAAERSFGETARREAVSPNSGPTSSGPTSSGPTSSVRSDQGGANQSRPDQSRSDRARGEMPRGFANFDRLMTAAQLRALIALSQRPNFTAAAKSIGLSQPSLHRAVRNLEALSGVTLFRKAETGIQFSPAAQALVRAAKLAWSELRQGNDEIDVHLGRDSSQIVVGTLPLPRTYLLPKTIHRMVQAFPGVQLRTIDGPFTEQARALQHGEIDFLVGALRSDLDPADFRTEKLFDDPLAVVAGVEHPLAGRSALTMADLLAYPWIAPPRNTPAGSYLYETLDIANLEETPVRVVSSSLVLVRGLLKQGPYLTILSRHQVHEELANASLVALDLPLANSSRPIGLTFRSHWRPTARQAAFLALMAETAGEIDAEGL